MSILSFVRHPRIKTLANAFGVTTSAVLWRPFAKRQYRRKLENDRAFRAWWENKRQAVESHWAHETIDSEVDKLHLASQLYELTKLLRSRMDSVGAAAVLDAGASDGVFMQQLGVERGVGLNLLDECTKQIRSDGFTAVQGDIEHLPFPDASFEHVLCCETLEHVSNPIATLNELARVCKARIYLTIPWLPRTRINSRPSGWPDVEGHIFEFSEADFAHVLTHAKVRRVYQDRVRVFPRPRDPLAERWLRAVMYPSVFPELQYYELEPVR